MSETRTIAAGGTTFEHGLLFGKNDDVAKINDANLYAAVVAKDLRGAMANVEGSIAALPGRIDLSKAKAWVRFIQSTNTILDSRNVKAISTSTGLTTITFGVPFKTPKTLSGTASGPVAFISGTDPAGNADHYIDQASGNAVTALNRSSGGSNVNSTQHLDVIVYGELETE